MSQATKDAIQANFENFTVVIPCKNEVATIGGLVRQLRNAGMKVIVVDDGSDDGTSDEAELNGASVIIKERSQGNGAAVRSGLSQVETEFAGVMDGDGQHSVSDMMKLCQVIINGKYDLVVGARDRSGQASIWKYLANAFYNLFASFIVGQKVLDLTSGQRVFRTKLVKSILWMFPNKFSYPTTSTMVFFRLGYEVSFVPVSVSKAHTRSNIRLVRDGFKFFLIVTKVGTLFSPFKLFLPFSLILFFLATARYIYTFATDGTFTNMSALLYVSSLLVFFIGVISEQISLLTIAKISEKN